MLAERLLEDGDRCGPMMCKILSCIERLSVRVPLLNETVSVLIIPEILASTIRVGVRTGKQVREQSLADDLRADILWVRALCRF